MKYGMNQVLMNEEAGDEGLPGGGEAAPVAAAPAADGKWYDSLPEDMREDANVTKFDSVEGLTKSWQNAQRMIGKDKIPMPETDEDWGNVYGRLGRPDEASGYTIEAGEGVQVDEAMQEGFLSKAHELGLSQKQVQGLAEWQIGTGTDAQVASDSANESALTEAMDSLKSEWGQAFDQKADIARRAIKEFASDEDKEFLNTAKIGGVNAGDHPAIIKMFNKIGGAMMESGKLEGNGSESAMTPQDIQDKISSLMANPAYTDRKHPEHKQVSRQVTQMFELQAG